MEIIADLHLHSKYSRAVSRDMNLSTMALWAQKKGLNLLTTGDWTHPLWLREIKQELEETSKGIYELKSSADAKAMADKPKFVLSVEVSSIYSQGGKVRRIHCLLFAPSIEVAEKMNAELVKRGANLTSDGRPIVGLIPSNLLEILMGIDDCSFLIPCHAWTPWFSLYGSMSGFDSIKGCFGDYSKYIYGIETGLSSDPAMNWRIKELDNRSILSFSDAHSPAKMGREATVFVPKDGISNVKSQMSNVSFDDIRLAIMRDPKAKFKVGYTVEFYPEEGKYHFTGHRNCGYVQTPEESRKDGTICPVCKRPLTVGVMHRVEDLAKDGFSEEVSKTNTNGVKWIIDPSKKHPSFVKLVPLLEILAESMDSTVTSQKVKDVYDKLCENFGGELNVLLRAPVAEIAKNVGEKTAQGIEKVRKGDIEIKAGFDGQYGVVKIWKEPQEREKLQDSASQLGIDF